MVSDSLEVKVWPIPYSLVKLVPSQREKLGYIHVIFGSVSDGRTAMTTPSKHKPKAIAHPFANPCCLSNK